jgi:hypothetical protein
MQAEHNMASEKQQAHLSERLRARILPFWRQQPRWLPHLARALQNVVQSGTETRAFCSSKE